MSAPCRNPARATLGLAVGLTLLAAGLSAAGPAEPLLPDATVLSPLALLAGLTALFCFADLCLLHVEVRREAYSVTLAGMPMVLAMLLCGSREAIAARVLGSAVAFAFQRSPLLKAGYNLAAYGFEVGVNVLLVNLLLGDVQVLSGQVAMVCYLVVLTVDQLMTLLVVRVISWHQGALTARQVAAVHFPALLCSALATTGALGFLILAGQGPVGMIVLTVAIVALAVAYRGFQLLHRRHEALEHVHDFVGLTSGASSVEELAGRMLGQVRTLMRASTAELLLIDPDTTLQLCSADDGGLRVTIGGWASTDWLVDRVREHATPALLRATTRDRHERTWLNTRSLKDAVIVPLPKAAGDGALMIFDRLGDTGSFTGEDQALLQTLAGHLSMAIRSTKLLERLRYEATHDVLTGLANRSLLRESIHAQLSGSDGTDTAVLLLDLDRFKEVNDTLGHHVGDALLCAVAERIVAVLPPTATVARLGGDEFAAMIPLPAGGPLQPQALAQSLAEALAAPVALPEATLTTRASIGIALSTPGCSDSDLLRHADTAMYAAKESGSTIVLYTAEMDRGRAERLALLADLHLALERDELKVLYQPKLDLTTGRIISAEALVRWQHPRLGLLSPDTFIPLAEANSLIAPLTQQVLHEALRQCAAWAGDGVDLAVAVNLSARSVNDPTLPDLISAALLAAGVPASRLILEITETSIMDDPDRAVQILDRIAAIGVTLSLDDFGTGYSSLSYLQRLPVRELKIDRSFITGLRTNASRSQVLVRSIIGLATSLGHRVVAEGVEDAQTLDLLRELGCHLAQGYYVSRPTTPEQVAACHHAHAGRAPRLIAVAT